MINKDKINKFKARTQDTVELDLGDYGSVSVRTFIDEPTQEAFATSVANNIFDSMTGHYNPIRKEALMTLMFVNAFIVSGDDLLMAADGDEADLYATHDMVANNLNLINKSIEAAPAIKQIMERISNAVDMQVKYMADNFNAAASGNVYSTSAETLENIDDFVRRASEFVVEFKGQMIKNSSKLGKLITKKNIGTAVDHIATAFENVANQYKEDVDAKK